MKLLYFPACFSMLLSCCLGLHAQVCDPSVAPTGLMANYTPGMGALLEWEAVSGSVGVQLKVNSPSGVELTRRILGTEIDQFSIPDAFLSPGTYTWRVQAACQLEPPYGVTPISAPSSFAVGGAGGCPVSVSDIDGNVYGTVGIGDQCWMAENLKVERYRNGDAIPSFLSDSAWIAASEGASAVYRNIPANKITYGLLYNWFAASDPRGLCPVGWHTPTDAEWSALITELDPLTCDTCIGSFHSAVAGGAMKSTGTLTSGTGLWKSPNSAATNSSGFTALPGGSRRSNTGGVFVSVGWSAIFWSSSEESAEAGWRRILNFDSGSALRTSGTKQSGYSIRCLQD